MTALQGCDRRCVVVGGGLVGGMATLAFAKLGHAVTLYERAEDWRKEEGEVNGMDRAAVKRSINLALSKRGEEALRNVGVLEEALKLSVPMYGRALHLANGQRAFQPYSETDPNKCIRSISREYLTQLLLSKAEKCPNVTIKYGQQLIEMDKSLHLHFSHPASKTSSVVENADLIIGCDGAYSAVRESLMRLQSTDYSRKYIKHGYKELSIPATNGKYQLEPANALHIWPRGDFMMIALPNTDFSFTCTIFAPMEELQSLKEEKDIRSYVERNFSDIPQYMPDFVEQFKSNPACRLVTMQVNPWNYGSKVVIIGDAAHAMVPFYGQGMNSGFEDTLELFETIQSCGNDLEKAVPLFAQVRRPRGDAIAALSLQNYVEMRSHTASWLFRIQKKVEGVLHRLMPDGWIPIYTMVAFTRIPYDEALEREKRQSAILTSAVRFSALGFGALAAWFGYAKLRSHM